MKVLIQEVDRYGDSPVSVNVINWDGKLAKVPHKLIVPEWYEEQLDDADGDESEVDDDLLGGKFLLNKAKTTAHFSGEETDYILIDLDAMSKLKVKED